MMTHYPFYDKLNLSEIAEAILTGWKKNDTFKKSLALRKGGRSAVFYEGPPGANGMPGIHHVFSRTLKDLFCRYKTMCGYQVARKAGWDTHGLPVEMAVEGELGITKEDIGRSISIEEYNAHCRKAVFKYQKEWELMTEKIGYWLDMDKPYMTCATSYISVLWSLLKALYEKDYLYKGYSIQPYSPAAGTGLSSHELNQPGCYKEVRDVTVVAQFLLKEVDNTYLLAWTTTPWTLPANSALAVDPAIQYVKIETFNKYTHMRIYVVLAEAAIERYFDGAHEEKDKLAIELPGRADAPMPWRIESRGQGNGLIGLSYEQLMPYIQPDMPAFRVIGADFVTTTEGTGIVHIAPTFGADDRRVAEEQGIPAITVPGPGREAWPIVDRKGCFVPEITDFAGAYVKSAYNTDMTEEAVNPSVDIRIATKLKEENKAFRIHSYAHSYPHCWRTEKPIIYYPLSTWFIRTTACKEELIALNKTICWQPPATGEGRFGNWLEGLVDWNITRDRFWGTPLPIWRTKDGGEERCIGGIEELREEVDRAVAAGVMKAPLPEAFDLHRPYVDEIVLLSAKHQRMYREKAVVDVWFDSGGMPYAQHGGAFSRLPADFPADFIIEGVDQTRGWFFTLHVLSVLLYRRISYKNVLSTGLVLDKKGRKMSKRIGNTVEPAKIIEQYGPDVLRWYMVAHANPWENLKFNEEELQEVNNKFFGTLHNTYQFFALYANLDGFKPDKKTLDAKQATVSDRWILSKLQELITMVRNAYDAFSPTDVVRGIQNFVINSVSNWYVRLNRKRFWQGGYTEDRMHAYRTLHTCLVTVAQLAAPIAPFYMDRLYKDLYGARGAISVHLTDFPTSDETYRDQLLERSMHYAQVVSSLIHRLRKKHCIKVRQPLAKMVIPVSSKAQKAVFNMAMPFILAETNVKRVEFVAQASNMVHKYVKPNFQVLGRRYGAKLKGIQRALLDLTQGAIQRFEEGGKCTLCILGESITLSLGDVLIVTKDVPGWAVAGDQGIIVALDLQQTPELVAEGMTRELVNRIQRIRKAHGLTVEDKIVLSLATRSRVLHAAFEVHKNYLVREVQATFFAPIGAMPLKDAVEAKIGSHTVHVHLVKAAECAKRNN